MNYLQLFADHEDYLAPLDDAERGRLLTAMLAYCFRGEEPDLPGNERYIWPVFRRMIDQSREALEKKQAAGKSRHAQQEASENSTSQQTEAQVSTEQQTAAQTSTSQQNSPLNKNQESRNKKQESDNGGVGACTPLPTAKRMRFTPPTPEDVRTYCLEKGYSHVDADRFCDFYASKGWRVGNQPMKDWQAAVRTWATRDERGGTDHARGNKPPSDVSGASGESVFHLPHRVL